MMEACCEEDVDMGGGLFGDDYGEEESFSSKAMENQNSAMPPPPMASSSIPRSSAIPYPPAMSASSLASAGPQIFASSKLPQMAAPKMALRDASLPLGEESYNIGATLQML